VTTPERHHAHTAVIRHYRGELAAGQRWPWLAGARETIRNRVVDAYADLTDQVPAVDALPLLREAITVDPYNEHLHHRTIAALPDLGDHPAATRLHAAYLARLTNTGLQPGTSTTPAIGSS
jgi:two-component SAPR family response regulator